PSQARLPLRVNASASFGDCSEEVKHSMAQKKGFATETINFFLDVAHQMSALIGLVARRMFALCEKRSRRRIRSLVPEFAGAASKMLCNRAQQGLQFLGVDVICGHQGANDGIGQHLVNGYFGALWHRTLIILSNCPQRAKNVSERARCRSQLQLRDRKRDHNDNQRVHSASRQRTDTSWRTANAT